jgi:hemolysin III
VNARADVSSPIAEPSPSGLGRPPARPRMRGWLHLYAVGVAAAAGVVLVSLAASRPGLLPFFACLPYALTVCGLFGVSALYHRHTWGPRGYSAMKRLDHSMIFVFIAGTYTPLYLLLLPRGTARSSLLLVWAGAAAGVALKMWWPRAPKWVGVPLYIALGWAAVFVLPRLLHRGGVAALVLIVVGGVAYSVGAVLYATKWPNPWPTTFGHHEFFHACTLLAAACHMVAIFLALYA